MLTMEQFPQFREKMAARIKEAVESGRFIVQLTFTGHRDVDALAARYPGSEAVEGMVTAVFSTANDALAWIIKGESYPHPDRYFVRDILRTSAFPSKRSFITQTKLDEKELMGFMNEISDEDAEREYFRKFIHEHHLASLKKNK